MKKFPIIETPIEPVENIIEIPVEQPQKEENISPMIK